jgi:Ca-activated chloride channel family protein
MLSYLWDLLDPGFVTPVWLAVGALATGLMIWLETRTRALRELAIRTFAASHLAATLVANVSPVRRTFKALLLIFACGLLFIALARPYLFYEWTDEKQGGLDVLLAVDCSKSMLTQDVLPSRLERAKLSISDFAAHLPQDRLGLIAFAGEAFLQCPLTLDHDAFLESVRDLNTETIPRPGTDIATAIEEASDALRSQPANMKFLILISDGEDLEGRVLAAARNAAQDGLRIYTVGVGTPEGDRVPEHADAGYLSYHHDQDGNEVISRLDEGTLRQIADITGGAYEPLGQTGDGLEQIYQRYIAPLPRQDLKETREKIHIERFEWPLGVAILFLMWEFVISERARGPKIIEQPRRPVRRHLATVSVLIVGALLLPLHAGDLANAQRAYLSGDYDKAMQDYEKASETYPAWTELQFNRGAAAYKAGEFNEAEEAFCKALETPNLNLQEQSYYNLGNTQYQHGAALRDVDRPRTIELWKAALHSYECALKLRTAADSKHNYDFVKGKLDELMREKPTPNGDQGSSESGQGQSGTNGQQSSPSSPNPSSTASGNSGSNGSSGNPADQNKPGSGGQNAQPDNSTAISGNPNLQAYSGQQTQGPQEPQIRSRQDAESLLDSLQGEERHITARSYNSDGMAEPPPSGKDW